MQKIDRSYRRSLHTVLENHIPQDVIEKGNVKKLWKYGYNAEYDVVVISKDGTIGEIIAIEGLPIALPSVPKGKIRLDERPARDQKWERYKVPAELMFFDKMYKDEPNPENKWREVEKKNIKFIDADIKRKFNGDWYMNDGLPTYITGHHFFFLQHYKLTSNKYPDLRLPQRDYFIFMEACIADDRCIGSLLLKQRRSAFSTSACSTILNKSITIRNGFFPVVSKTNDDSKSMFKKHIVRPLNHLPKYLQPQRVGEVSPEKELTYTSPKKKITTNNKSDASEGGLDTSISHYPTTIDAYDGERVTYSINDEIGKMKGNLDINEYWDQAHKMCHIIGDEVVGKAICGSTANPPHKGGKNYAKFYEDSKISSRGEDGQTATGLYSIFIPADYSSMGFFDEFGYPIYDDPSEPILNERGKLKSMGVKNWLDTAEAKKFGDVGKYNAQKRNNPRVDTDPFLDENATNTFATTGMVNHINFLKEFHKTPKYKTNVFRFDLYYKPTTDNPLNVEMKRTDKGRFIASWLPPMELRNKFRMKDGKRYPVNESLGGLGNDPYQADRTKYGGGSKMGMVGVTTNNQHNLVSWERNKTFVFYNFRPDTVEEAETDAIKLMLYLSMPILIESNKDGFVKRLYRDKLTGYAIKDPTKDKKADYSDAIKKYGGIYTTPATRAKEEEALETYLQDHVHDGVDEDDIKVPFLDLNIMATEYTDATRTKLDGVVAWQLACLAVSKINEKFTKIDSEKVSQQEFDEQFKNQNNQVRIIDLFKRKVQ